MSGWMDEWVDRWMDGLVNGQWESAWKDGGEWMDGLGPSDQDLCVMTGQQCSLLSVYNCARA